MQKSSQTLSEEEYNEPWYYCEACHSAFVKVDETLADEDWDGSFCGKCFSPHIVVCKFGEWLEEEERREEKRIQREWNR